MKGLLVIISAPSGGGKDAVIQGLLKKIPRSARLVTTTTRTPRPDDREGVNYFFITPELFKQKMDNGEFVEYNLYAGNYYGTERKVLDDFLNNNEVVFSSIEVNGKHNLDRLNVQNLAIFLNPESLDILRKRIQKRGGTTPESLEERLKLAEKEIKDSADYDYHLENKEGNLAETVQKIDELLKKMLEERKTLDKSTGLR